jgi:hypothetical protein
VPIASSETKAIAIPYDVLRAVWRDIDGTIAVLMDFRIVLGLAPNGGRVGELSIQPFV